jgi:SAM-dependent methyltransferase
MEMDREFWNDSFLDHPDQTEVRDVVIAEEVVGLKPGRALDLGCGAGTNALMLAGSGWSVTGVDWSVEAVRLATGAAARRDLEARFLVVDITDWEAPEHFDLVISTYALPTGEDGEAALRTAASALAPGGVLLVVEWDISMQEEWGFEDGDFVSLATMREIVTGLGLQIEKAEVRKVSEMFSDPEDHRYEAGRQASIAFIRARRQV